MRALGNWEVEAQTDSAATTMAMTEVNSRQCQTLGSISDVTAVAVATAPPTALHKVASYMRLHQHCSRIASYSIE